MYRGLPVTEKSCDCLDGMVRVTLFAPIATILPLCGLLYIADMHRVILIYFMALGIDMAISTPVVFVRRFSLLYYLVKTLFSFMVVVVVGVIPILVIYLQKDYLWLHYYGLIMLLFLVFYAIKKFSCIDHDKFAELIIKPKIIKDKDASFLFHKAFWRDAQVIEEMFKPLFKNKLLNKVFYYCLVKYLSVYIIFVLSLNGAAAMFYNRTYGPRAVIYIMLFALLHIGFSYVRNLLYYYAMTKFLYKKQKELGRWLISI